MHPIFHAFLNACLQFACLTCALFAMGLVIGYLARCINSVYSSFMFPKLGLYIFGLVGIPAHEFTHFIFCKLFRLEVTKVKWFDVKAKGGAHGVVEHNYDPSNPVHRFAHLFVGFGPVLLLPPLIAALFWHTFPNGHIHNFWNWRTPAFLYFSFALVAHMDLSKEDLKVASSGLPILFFTLLLGNVIATFCGVDMNHLLQTFAFRAWNIWSPVFGICLAIAILQLGVAWIATSTIHFLFGQPPVKVLP